jgi:hypothetical protein
MILVWFVLADGTKLASQVVALPRPGDVVRFATDGEAYDVTQIEHIATTARPRLGMRYTKIVIRLSPTATRRC